MLSHASCASLRPLLGALLLGASAAAAADFHVTPGGAGKMDGSGWANALPPSALEATFNDRMQAGDRLRLGSGTYPQARLNLARGGDAGRPKIVAGVDTGTGLPVLSADWTIERPEKGPTAITLGSGVSHVTLQHLRIKGYCFGVRAQPAPEAARTQLVFDDIDIEQARHPFYLSDCDDLRFTGCDLKRYSKHGFRFDQGCDRVTLRQCTADCSEGDAVWETKTEVFPFGFLLNDGGAPNTEFVFEDCVARHNLKSNQTVRYTNGDGFVVEGNARGVSFTRCRALRNQDGGFDLKVADVKLTDCIAIGHRRDYRIWKNATLTNCFAGWSTTGLWCNGGPVTAEHCTFHEHRGAAAETDDKATAGVTVIDGLITGTPASPKLVPSLGRMELQKTAVATAKQSGADPAYPKADPQWDGTGPAMDSRTYPDHGYRSTRVAAAPAVAR